MKSPLDQLEARFKSLFEGNSVLSDQPDSITHLLHFIDEYLHSLIGQKEELPEKFGLYLNQTDMQLLDDQPGMKDAIPQIMVELAAQYGYNFTKKPGIKYITRNSLLPDHFEIKPIRLKRHTDQTNAIQASSLTSSDMDEEHSRCATLLFGDDTLLPLLGSVTNLGRKSNNHIIFDDLRVSRNHAQIRQIFDDFIIFDTGSTGGTYVNGERITQCKLKTGDVISLAGVKLIFSKEGEFSDSNEREITSKLGSTKKVE